MVRESIDEFLRRHERARRRKNLVRIEPYQDRHEDLAQDFLLDHSPGTKGRDIHEALTILHPIYAQEQDPQRKYLVNKRRKAENLEKIVEIIDPPHQEGVAELFRAKIEFVIELYKGERRKNGHAYAVEHPLGILHAILRYAERQHIPSTITLVAAFAAPDHDFGELILNDMTDVADPENPIERSKNPITDIYKISDRDLRNKMLDIGCANEEGTLRFGLEDPYRMSIVADIIVTKTRTQHWDEYAQETMLSKTIRQVYSDCYQRTPDEDTVDIIKAAILLVKMSDLNYNIRDHDLLVRGKVPITSLEFRADGIHKALTFSNLITRYFATRRNRPYLALFVPDQKEALLEGVRQQTITCMDYLLHSRIDDTYALSNEYVCQLPAHLAIFEKYDGFRKAKRHPSTKELRIHPWKRFHGSWLAMIEKHWSKQERKNREQGFDKAKDTRQLAPEEIRHQIDFKNPFDATDYFATRYQIAQLKIRNQEFQIYGTTPRKTSRS
jgi:hypothetical protein